MKMPWSVGLYGAREVSAKSWLELRMRPLPCLSGQGHRGCTMPHTGAPRYRIASPVYSEMDTNGDGAVTQADDPYAPYYPGRPRPVPCGRLRFCWEAGVPGMAGVLS